MEFKDLFILVSFQHSFTGFQKALSYPQLCSFIGWGVSVLYICPSKKLSLCFGYWQQECGSWNATAWSHSRNVTPREPCPDTNIKGVMRFLHVLIVKCQPPPRKVSCHSPPWHSQNWVVKHAFPKLGPEVRQMGGGKMLQKTPRGRVLVQMWRHQAMAAS